MSTPDVVVVQDIERELLEMWHEGTRSPVACQQEFTPEQLKFIERMAAADLVKDMRDVRIQSATWSDLARDAYEQRFAALAKEFAEAAEHLRRLRHDRDYVPPFLRAAPSLTLVKS